MKLFIQVSVACVLVVTACRSSSKKNMTPVSSLTQNAEPQKLSAAQQREAKIDEQVQGLVNAFKLYEKYGRPFGIRLEEGGEFANLNAAVAEIEVEDMRRIVASSDFDGLYKEIEEYSKSYIEDGEDASGEEGTQGLNLTGEYNSWGEKDAPIENVGGALKGFLFNTDMHTGAMTLALLGLINLTGNVINFAYGTGNAGHVVDTFNSEKFRQAKGLFGYPTMTTVNMGMKGWVEQKLEHGVWEDAKKVVSGSQRVAYNERFVLDTSLTGATPENLKGSEFYPTGQQSGGAQKRYVKKSVFEFSDRFAASRQTKASNRMFGRQVGGNLLNLVMGSLLMKMGNDSPEELQKTVVALLVVEGILTAEMSYKYIQQFKTELLKSNSGSILHENYNPVLAKDFETGKKTFIATVHTHSDGRAMMDENNKLVVEPEPTIRNKVMGSQSEKAELPKHAVGEEVQDQLARNRKTQTTQAEANAKPTRSWGSVGAMIVFASFGTIAGYFAGKQLFMGWDHFAPKNITEKDAKKDEGLKLAEASSAPQEYNPEIDGAILTEVAHRLKEIYRLKHEGQPVSP